jgi:hypothetical protein
LPNQDGLKSAVSVAGVRSVILTVSSGAEILDEQELAISENTATGTVKIEPGNNIKFTAEATDENNIVQWQGSTTIDVDDDFTVDLELMPILPSAPELQGFLKESDLYLSWNQNADADFAGYVLYRSQSENSTGAKIYSSTDKTDTVFTNIRLPMNVTFYYTLTVFDTEGFGAESNVLTIEIPDPGVSSQPPRASILQGTRNGGSVDLSWTRNADADFSHYELYRSGSLKTWGTLIYTSTVVSNTKFTEYSLSENSTFYFRLIVFDTEGLYAESNLVMIYIPVL